MCERSITVPVRTEKNFQHPPTTERHRLSRLHSVGIAITTTRAGPIFRPTGLFQPLCSGFLSRKHPRQLRDSDAFTVGFSGGFLLRSLHHEKIIPECISLVKYIIPIPYLAPSHPEWQTRPAWGRLQLPSIDYHAKNLVHEITHAAELSIWGYFYKAPAPWIAEGLAEYEGLFNTTESNRMQGLEKLLEEVRRNAGSKIGCCESLTGNHPEITCGDVYFGGSFILKYLADKFGEEIHDRLIRSEFPTFGEALSSEFANQGTTLPRVFLGMKAWLNGEEEPSFDSPGSRRRTRTRQVRGRKFN